jgi:signal transduction histidine kinase
LLKEQQKAAFGIYETQQRAGNYHEALIWHERYTGLTEELFNSENQERLAELEEKYHTKQKLQKINSLSVRNKTILLQNQLTTNRLNLALLSGAFILLGIVFMGVLFYQRSKRQQLRLEGLRQRHNEQVNKIMNEQEIVLLAATIDAQHYERKKLAKDIHDNLGSYLATLKYQHETISPDVNDPGLKAHHAVTAQLIEAAFAEVRSVSHQMATGLSMSFTLIPAIEELIDRIRTTRQFVVEMYSYPEEIDVPREKALHLYKIVQELLSNILKHARANHVSIHIHCDNGEINLMIEDDGVGFDRSVVVSGIGLTNIRERMEHLQGELEINSLPGKGTTILIIVPFYSTDHDSIAHSR